MKLEKKVVCVMASRVKKTESSEYHDRIAEQYESDYSSPYWQLYDEITWRNMKRFLPKKKKAVILDVGGGTGHWSRALAKLGYCVVCSDLSEKMLQVAKKKANEEGLDGCISFIQADITDMRCFKGGFFDMVIAQGDPVGFCDDPEKAIAELSRVAKKGAHVCVSIDGFFSTLSDLIAAKKHKDIDRFEKTKITEFHGSFPVHHFTPEDLRRLFKENDLEMVTIIGKPAINFDLHQDEVEKLLSDKKIFKRVLALEMKHNSEPSIVGYGRHIEAIGKKV